DVVDVLRHLEPRLRENFEPLASQTRPKAGSLRRKTDDRVDDLHVLTTVDAAHVVATELTQSDDGVELPGALDVEGDLLGALGRMARDFLVGLELLGKTSLRLHHPASHRLHATVEPWIRLDEVPVARRLGAVPGALRADRRGTEHQVRREIECEDGVATAQVVFCSDWLWHSTCDGAHEQV